MKYMLMMHAPRGTGDYQIGRWSPADLEAHTGCMHRFRLRCGELRRALARLPTLVAQHATLP